MTVDTQPQGDERVHWLPMVAAMMMGAMSKQVSQPQGGGLSAGTGGGLLDMLAPMLDRNGDGSALDDVIGSVGKWLGGRPS